MTDPAAMRPIYLDTNVFIKAVGGTEEAAAPARSLIEFLRQRRGLSVTSEITLAELLAPPKRANALPLHIKRRAYLDLLVWSGFITLVPVSRSVLMETADLRTVSNLRLPDAIHLVTAVQSDCRYFVSSDKGIRPPDNMKWIAPEAEGIDEILKVFA